MKRLLIALALAFAGTASASQVIYGYTPGAPGTWVVAEDEVGAKVLTASDTKAFYSLVVSNNFTGFLYPTNNLDPFQPARFQISSLVANFRADFTSMPVGVYGIVYSTNGVPEAGTPIDITGNSTSLVWITGAGGSYHVRLPTNWSGTVTPVPIYGKMFAPTHVEITELCSNYHQNFSLGGEYISGIVTNLLTGYGVNGVTVTFTGATSYATLTTNGGTYGITLPYGWAGTCAPSLAHAVFTPTNISYAGGVRDVVFDANFAVRLPALRISGRITRYKTTSTGIRGVPMVFSDGTTVFTDDYGYYVHEVSPGWTGTVVPSAYPLVFYPESRTFSNVVRSVSLRDFLWIPLGMQYTDPLGFLTNVWSGGVAGSFAEATQISVNTSGFYYAAHPELRGFLGDVDATLGGVVSDIRFQEDIKDLISDSEWVLSAENMPLLWGGLICAKGMWSGTNMECSTLSTTNLTADELTATHAALPMRAVSSYYTTVPEILSVSAFSNRYFEAAPSYLTTTAGLYSVRLAVHDPGGISAAAHLAVGVAPPGSGATYLIRGNTTGTWPSRLCLDASIFLDAGTRIRPYLYSPVDLVPRACSALMIHVKPPGQVGGGILE